MKSKGKPNDSSTEYKKVNSKLSNAAAKSGVLLPCIVDPKICKQTSFMGAREVGLSRSWPRELGPCLKRSHHK